MSGFHLQSFDHLTLIVADVTVSRRFYVEQLGFEEVERPAFDFPGAWFRLSESMIHVTQESELAGRAGWGDRAVGSLSRGHHIAYATTDFDNALLAIQKFGIEIAAGPQTRPDGARQVYIFDPDRHVIEICTRN